MTSYTDAEIEELITCSKNISRPPAKNFKTEGKFRRNDLELMSGDNKLKFSVFVRHSLVFIEDFSVGICFHAPDGKKIILLRYNGQHEVAKDPTRANDLHYLFHIHKATAESLSNERYDKPPQWKEADYGCFDDAIEKFFEDIGVGKGEFEKAFPDINSHPLLKGLK